MLSSRVNIGRHMTGVVSAVHCPALVNNRGIEVWQHYHLGLKAGCVPSISSAPGVPAAVQTSVTWSAGSLSWVVERLRCTACDREPSGVSLLPSPEGVWFTGGSAGT